jgi:hypothetical protein
VRTSLLSSSRGPNHCLQGGGVMFKARMLSSVWHCHLEAQAVAFKDAVIILCLRLLCLRRGYRLEDGVVVSRP